MKTIRTSLNYDPSKHSNPEKFTMPSKTVPDQTMSINEILQRYARGLPIEGAKVPMYDESDDPVYLPDPRTLDLTELQELRQEIVEELKSINQPKAPTKPQAGNNELPFTEVPPAPAPIS